MYKSEEPFPKLVYTLVKHESNSVAPSLSSIVCVGSDRSLYVLGVSKYVRRMALKMWHALVKAVCTLQIKMKEQHNNAPMPQTATGKNKRLTN